MRLFLEFRNFVCLDKKKHEILNSKDFYKLFFMYYSMVNNKCCSYRNSKII